MTLTPAQKRALAWLPADGNWRMKPGRLWGSVNSLALFHHNLIQVEYGNFGPRKALCWRWRLTPAGIVARAEIEGEGK
jgi:hypothetical protein